MININLISRKRNVRSQKNWTRIVFFGLFGLFLVYFLGVTAYVLISVAVLNVKINKAETDSLSISKSMMSNSESLSRFVLTKVIVSEIGKINKTRFHYKEYLDQVSEMLPLGTTLTGVDFSIKGWISLSVSSTSIYPLSFLEKVLIDKSNWSNSKYFSGAYVEGVNRGKDGSYSTRLQLEIKGNV